MADFITIASQIKSLKEQGAVVNPQKNFIQITNTNGVRMYVAQPGKNGTTRVVDLAETGYDGTLNGEPITAKVETTKVPGAVAFRYDLDSDNGKFFTKLCSAFMSLKPSPSGKVRGKRASSSAPLDVNELLGLNVDQGSEPALSGRLVEDSATDSVEV
jgi:hypothetical protein